MDMELLLRVSLELVSCCTYHSVNSGIVRKEKLTRYCRDQACRIPITFLVSLLLPLNTTIESSVVMDPLPMISSLKP